jgi:hypothetical protein
MVSVRDFAEPERSLEALTPFCRARTRRTRRNFVACRAAGRTLYALEATSKRIARPTGTRPAVTIASWVHRERPRARADADLGYVGGGAGQGDLYVGKTPVEFNIRARAVVNSWPHQGRGAGRTIRKLGPASDHGAIKKFSGEKRARIFSQIETGFAQLLKL